MRKLLIKLLGGHTSQELAFLKTEFEKTKLECDEYIIFVNSVCNYVGSYPVWKAQQEYREEPLAKTFSNQPINCR